MWQTRLFASRRRTRRTSRYDINAIPSPFFPYSLPPSPLAPNIPTHSLPSLPSFSSPRPLVPIAPSLGRCLLCQTRIISFSNGVSLHLKDTLNPKPLQVPSQRLIIETLSYAKELERIV